MLRIQAATITCLVTLCLMVPAWAGDVPTDATEHKALASLIAAFPSGTIHEPVMMPMRDGVKLATNIFRPAGDGKFPVLLTRTPYSRFDRRVSNVVKVGAPLDVIAVTQNQRGVADSEGENGWDFFNEGNDSYDTVEWIAKQPWCNGRVVMQGASGSGISCAAAIYSKAPHLYAVFTTVTGDDFYRNFGFYNGVRRGAGMYGWIEKRHRGKRPADWPRPTTMSYDEPARAAFLAAAGKDNHVLTVFTTAWYDCLGEGAQDAYTALLGRGKIWGSISNSGHGSVGGRPQAKVKGGNGSPALISNDLEKALLGTAKIPAESVVKYTLMGDSVDPNAPGNKMMETKVWPVPSTPTAYYLHKGGVLSTTKPADADATVTYAYDPKNAVPSLGGRYYQGEKITGPFDQTPNKSRSDVLHFATVALTEPVGITGTLAVDLAFSTDVDDTMFVVNLVDIYPDGYEAYIAGGPMMARYVQGLNTPAPLEKGKTYNLKFNLWGTAIVFNTGHKIGVYISSSSDPAYEVHPNSYKPVTSFDGCPVAHQVIHVSAEHASRIILPVIAPDTYMK